MGPTLSLPCLAHLLWLRYYLLISVSLLPLVVLVLPPSLGPTPDRKEMRQLRSSRDLARAEQRVLAQQVHELER